MKMPKASTKRTGKGATFFLPIRLTVWKRRKLSRPKTVSVLFDIARTHLVILGRLVVLESVLGLESGLKSIFAGLGLGFGLGL